MIDLPTLSILFVVVLDKILLYLFSSWVRMSKGCLGCMSWSVATTMLQVQVWLSVVSIMMFVGYVLFNFAEIN